jgi:hypothetical protein
MADQKISELTELATKPDTADLLAIVDTSGTPTTKKITVANLISTRVDNETPTGTINGSNKEFTLAQAPNPSSSLLLIGTLVVFIQDVDYTLITNTITFTDAPPTGSILRAFYIY